MSDTEETFKDESHSLPSADEARNSVGMESRKANMCSHKCLKCTSIFQLLLIAILGSLLIVVLFVPKDQSGDNVVNQLRFSTRPHHIKASIISHVSRAHRHSPGVLGATQWNDETSAQAKALARTVSMGGASTSAGVAVSTYVLWVLQFTLNPASDGTGSNHWSTDDKDICMWKGVRCDRNGQVASLDLEDRGMSGDLPAELFLIASSLKDINVKDNTRIGFLASIPAWLEEMPQLQELNICGTDYGDDEAETVCNKIGVVPTIYADFDCTCCSACPSETKTVVSEQLESGYVAGDEDAGVEDEEVDEVVVKEDAVVVDAPVGQMTNGTEEVSAGLVVNNDNDD